MRNDRTLQLLTKWHARLRASQHAHYEDAAALGKRQWQLGIPVVILSSVGGATALLSVSDDRSWIQITIGLLSVTSAVLASVMTFLNYPVRQTTHLLAATRLSSLKKRIEERIATADGEGSEIVQFAREVCTEWNAITLSAPLLSEKTFGRGFHSALPEDVFDVVTASSMAPPPQDSGSS